MTVNIPPTHIQTVNPKRQRFRRPWNTDPSCVLCYMPEVNSTWIDYSDESNDGTLEGPTRVHNCRYGEGLYFDGSDDYINCGADASVNAIIRDTGMTLVFWVKVYDIEGGAIADIMSQVDGGGTGRSILYTKNTGQFYTFMDGIETVSTLTGTNNTWHHIVLAHDGTTIQFYLDGVAGNTRVRGIDEGATGDIIIGANKAHNNEWYKGYIDQVLFFTRRLKATEIKNLYEMGRPGVA